MSYSTKLKHPKWQRKRLEILQRDDFKCTMCGCDFRELHVHHLKYTGEPYDAPNEDLQTLCAECHTLETIANKSKSILLKTIRTKKLFFSRFIKDLDKSFDRVFIYQVDENGELLDSYIFFDHDQDFLKNLKIIINE